MKRKMTACLLAIASVLCTSAQGIYDIKVKDDSGKDVSLADYKGKVLLTLPPVVDSHRNTQNWKHSMRNIMERVWRFSTFHAISLVHKLLEQFRRFISFVLPISTSNFHSLIRLR